MNLSVVIFTLRLLCANANATFLISSNSSSANFFPDAFAPVLIYSKCVPVANPFIADLSPNTD